MIISTELLFEVFKTPEDHYSWDKHIEFAKRTVEIDPEVQQQWIAALQFLEEELGHDFLISDNGRHTIERFITLNFAFSKFSRVA